MAVDSSGYAYVTGNTSSTNFPTTSGAYQTSLAGGSGQDAFVTKLATDGKSLVYSTYLGGTGIDNAYSMAVDSSGYAYVAGYTYSTNFPTTAGAYQSSNAGNIDVFVTKLATDGKSLVYSTYLGSSNNDGNMWTSIAVDSSGYAYVAGCAGGSNFPTTAGAYQTAFQGSNWDGFVAKIDPSQSGSASLKYSTFLSGTGLYNWPYSIAVDSSGSAYVTGLTSSTDFPTTAGAYQTAFAGGMYDAFVTKLKADGTGLIYSTYLGGSGTDYGCSIRVDSNGYPYVSGQTFSTDFPTTAGALQTSNAGSTDVFVTKLANSGKSLYYSTYLGGNGFDYGTSIALDSSGNAYVGGRTASTNFPTSSGAYQTSNKGGSSGYDAYIFKLSGLPTLITLASFSVSLEQDGAHISWQTKSEVDNLGFNLFRVAPDGTNEVKLNSALIPGLISSAIGKDYSYVDTWYSWGNNGLLPA